LRQNQESLIRIGCALNFATPEYLVLFTAGTLRAPQAARQQYRHTGGDYQREEAFARHEPLN
jgi:hypothetical protein